MKRAPTVDEIHHRALKLLRTRDYTERQLRERLGARFGSVPDEIFLRLREKRFLNDRRYAENFAVKHRDSHPDWVRAALEEAGVDRQTISDAVDACDWPSLRSVLQTKMQAWLLRPPLQRREVARLYRALSRLGYPEDDVREELEQLHEQ